MDCIHLTPIRSRSSRKGQGPVTTPARAKAKELAELAWSFNRQQLQQIAPSDPIGFLIDLDPSCSKAVSAAVYRLLVEQECLDETNNEQGY